MRQNDSWLRFPVLVLLGVVVWTGWMYEQLPQVMVTHWGFLGDPNGWMDKLTGAWMLPLIMMLLWALWEVLPAADKRHCQSRAFLTPYWSMGNAVLVLLAAMQWGMFQYNFDAEFPLLRFVGWILVLFIAWLGRLLPEVPLNSIFGVRTPWTLADGLVWRVTHRETAKGLRTVALLSIIFQVVLPQPWSLVFILVSFLGILVWGVMFSFINRR
ncbi:MAG TPA: DUF1648 domain-containing protein [Anaerolineales bacterium]|nr:DUF1648 domain-containing protein [Anaerolineales bacterium]